VLCFLLPRLSHRNFEAEDIWRAQRQLSQLYEAFSRQEKTENPGDPANSTIANVKRDTGSYIFQLRTSKTNVYVCFNPVFLTQSKTGAVSGASIAAYWPVSWTNRYPAIDFSGKPRWLMNPPDWQPFDIGGVLSSLDGPDAHALPR
jgi:hypothetical protein